MTIEIVDGSTVFSLFVRCSFHISIYYKLNCVWVYSESNADSFTVEGTNEYDTIKICKITFRQAQCDNTHLTSSIVEKQFVKLSLSKLVLNTTFRHAQCDNYNLSLNIF